ncbi:DUF2157 domain-containing protein [Flaviramulus sp. BrNp1-15]|uniref:DUF2157 domain-containing protein n=1 Tax=Flaviramulus sp. BrNp1-15 TaxID=2916754 RepID=UPI001EE83303|nr:DUF2157 domain-containing protein [Flaviramulus sp. BrNp1-15]ULC59152.1 DUF2157 domain-containing protein [Flaviramulus sp. BrNp1-15]
MNSKIQNDIKELVEEQVISKEIAASIENYYKSKKGDTPNRLFTVFAVLGSTLVGLGIILILAHNWDSFSRSIKTVFAFTPLIIGQLIVGYTIIKKKNITWREASGVFLFFAVGSSIALVSQIYNIPGNFSSYMLTWVLLCAPLIYLLKSNALAILHIVFVTSYACSFGYFNGNNTPWMYLVLLAVMMPYYYQLLKNKKIHNITSIFNWLIPLSAVIVLGTFVKKSEELGFLMYVILFGLLYNIGKIPFFDNQKLRRNGYLILGSLGTIYMLLLTSFEWLWKDILRHEIIINSQEFYVSVVLLLVTLGVLIFSYSKKRIQNFNLFQYVFVMFTIIFFLGVSGSIISIILINLLTLILGVMAIKIGADKFHFGILNYGLLIITALIVCRFFDTNMSFVLRGLLFVSVGVGFFLTNYMMLKKQKGKIE